MTTRTPGDAPWTLGAALAASALRSPGRGLSIADGRGRSAQRRTWGELLAAAQRTAARLAALGVERGEPLPICLATSWDFIDAWFGALLCGAWPVAVAPPGGLGAAEHHLRKVELVCARLEARRIVCARALRDEAERSDLARLAALALAPEEVAARAPEPGFVPARAEPDDTAFLQLTSGSTGVPRAVVVRHRAALHNVRAIAAALEPEGGGGVLADCTGVSWLPLHHDMGLVGCLLFSMDLGLDLVLLSPRAFLGRPRTWLAELGAHARTLSPAPSFAYQTCVERVASGELEGVDLGRWRAALVGAEMIRPETLAAFAATFAERGFDARVFRPCYGLAEATLALTFDTQRAGLRSAAVPGGVDLGLALARVACVGAPLADTELDVVAPDGAPLGAGVIGAVRARGPGITSGYWRDPEASAEVLRDGWLETGDLGFLAGGELYLTGRTKDLILVHGQNVMPHELEWAAEAATGGGGTSRACAFSIARGGAGEEAVVVLEVAQEHALAELARAARVSIARTLSIPLADLVLVRRGRIPKTSSGKVQRAELRRRYLARELERLDPGAA